jgi:hypothetical protein
MNKINWMQKLSSRKFWALCAALAVSCVGAFGADAAVTETVAGIITAVGACVVYILAEGSVDKTRNDNEKKQEEKSNV